VTLTRGTPCIIHIHIHGTRPTPTHPHLHKTQWGRETWRLQHLLFYTECVLWYLYIDCGSNLFYILSQFFLYFFSDSIIIILYSFLCLLSLSFSHYSPALFFTISLVFFRCFSFVLHRCSSSFRFHFGPSLLLHSIYPFLLRLYFILLYRSFIFFSLLSFRFEVYFFSSRSFLQRKPWECFCMSICLSVCRSARNNSKKF